jgi:hypothetical protein
MNEPDRGELGKSERRPRRVQAEDLWALAVLSPGAAGLTAIVTRFPATRGDVPGRDVEAFFGGINPLLVIAMVGVVGVVSLSLLLSRGWFEIFERRASLRGVVVSAALATLFAVAIVIADFVVFAPVVPEEANVAWPQSLLFYPAIAYVVEVVFHALPLTLLLVVLGRLFKHLETDRLVWLGILLTSLLEPTFQWVLEPSRNGGYVWVHVFAFNLAQLYVFRRYDFVSMYSLRLFYYLYWHVAWGFLRLQVLF